MADAPAAPTPEQIAASKISGIPIGPQAQPEAPAGQPAPELTQDAAEQPQLQEGEQPLEGSPDEVGSEVEEIEFGDVRFPVPKEHVQKIKDALMREADYTRKTQDIAERARAISEQEKMFQAQQEFHRSSIDDIAQIRAIDQAIAQYANVNWMGMDMETLTRTRLQYDQLKEAREKAKQSLDSKWGEFNKKRAETLKNLERQGREETAKRIAGFNDENAKALQDYARKSGYTDQQIAMFFYNPLDVQMIWKAKQFDDLQANKSNISSRVNKAPPIVRPGAASQAKPADVRQMEAFKSAKDKKSKEALGAAILAQKMRI